MLQLMSRKGGGKASRKYFECYNKDKRENGKNQLLRKKIFWEEKSLSLESTLIIQGILVNTNNRLNVWTTGDISSVLVLNTFSLASKSHQPRSIQLSVL